MLRCWLPPGERCCLTDRRDRWCCTSMFPQGLGLWVFFIPMHLSKHQETQSCLPGEPRAWSSVSLKALKTSNVVAMSQWASVTWMAPGIKRALGWDRT